MHQVHLLGIPKNENPLAYDSAPFDMIIVMDKKPHYIPMPHVPINDMENIKLDWMDDNGTNPDNMIGTWDVWVAHRKGDTTVPTFITRIPRRLR